ncbi:MAG: PD-(D/E)XK nuclease family protein [Bacteroidales bacterium]|nr:PD-(D/E)XK nuclease family protein [Bacteroidales bacterium]
MKQNKPINLFNILSVADKELTHSSVIRLIIEQHGLFLNQFNINENSIIETEQSFKTGKNKRIRFDIIGYNKEDNKVEDINFFIENKFKATPTKSQLKRYDDFCKEKNISPQKILMVYFSEQISSDVKVYCEKNAWDIYPYFSTGKDNSFIDFLEKNKEKFASDDKVKFLINEYVDYLNNSWSVLSEKVNSKQLFVRSDFTDLDLAYDRERDIWSRYLMHIQSLISEKINENISYDSTNDGGSRHIPSVVFWFDNGGYYGIDGDNVKLGVTYDYKNYKTLEKIHAELNKTDAKKILGDGIDFRINNSKPKVKKEKDGSSVFFLISFKFKNWKEKDMFIESSGKILKKYYDYISHKLKS